MCVNTSVLSSPSFCDDAQHRQKRKLIILSMWFKHFSKLFIFVFRDLKLISANHRIALLLRLLNVCHKVIHRSAFCMSLCMFNFKYCK